MDREGLFLCPALCPALTGSHFPSVTDSFPWGLGVTITGNRGETRKAQRPVALQPGSKGPAPGHGTAQVAGLPPPPQASMAPYLRQAGDQCFPPPARVLRLVAKSCGHFGVCISLCTEL